MATYSILINVGVSGIKGFLGHPFFLSFYQLIKTDIGFKWKPCTSLGPPGGGVFIRMEGQNDICAAFLPAITRPTANCKSAREKYNNKKKGSNKR